MRSLLVLVTLACAAPPGTPASTPAQSGTFTLTVLGTNDVHGHLVDVGGKGGLPLLAGYVTNARAARAKDGGIVVLVDAGDAMQGTLDSNLDQGASIVRAYNVMGYDALTAGNHELDFGQSTLVARGKEAHFPILSANIVDSATKLVPLWAQPSVVIDRGGIKIGVIGVTTIDTPQATALQNLRGLDVVPLLPPILAESGKLRAAGCTVIILAAHAGAACTDLDHPDDLSSCDDGEIIKLARALPAGAVDVIVAGHTHKGIAQRVNGVAIVESFNNATKLSRVDLTIDRATGKATATHIFAPQDLVAGSYEGAPVVADAAVAAAVEPALAAARTRKEEKLGYAFPAPVTGGYETESALGDLVADLMAQARPDADVVVMNAGALHAELPAGDATYGALYDVYPFDNHYAFVKLDAAALSKLLARSLGGKHGMLLLAGLVAVAECRNGKLEVVLRRADGRAVKEGEIFNLVTSDFLVGGGDDFGLDKVGVAASAVTVDNGELLRDGMARVLHEHAKDLRVKPYDPAHLRIAYPGKRPVVCPMGPPPAAGGGVR